MLQIQIMGLHTQEITESILPASLGGHQLSNTSQDYPVSNESDKKTDESIPIYSKPDMNKKREERRKREQKEQEERTAALQKEYSVYRNR